VVRGVQQAVREKVGDAEIERDPFPHAVIPDLLPEEFFRQLAETIPLDAFEPKNDAKSNLPISDGNEYFEAAPEEFRQPGRGSESQPRTQHPAPGNLHGGDNACRGN
jgi:hypothetical protein